jgi:hypothetical protein
MQYYHSRIFFLLTVFFFSCTEEWVVEINITNLSGGIQMEVLLPQAQYMDAIEINDFATSPANYNYSYFFKATGTIDVFTLFIDRSLIGQSLDWSETNLLGKGREQERFIASYFKEGKNTLTLPMAAHLEVPGDVVFEIVIKDGAVASIDLLTNTIAKTTFRITLDNEEVML